MTNPLKAEIEKTEKEINKIEKILYKKGLDKNQELKYEELIITLSALKLAEKFEQEKVKKLKEEISKTMSGENLEFYIKIIEEVFE